MPKKKTKKESKIDLYYAVFVIPLLFVIGIVSYLGLSKLAKKNRRVCSFLGNVWLEGVPTDPSVRKGCFTYEELYK